jgi:hypothetical protein
MFYLKVTDILSIINPKFPTNDAYGTMGSGITNISNTAQHNELS